MQSLHFFSFQNLIFLHAFKILYIVDTVVTIDTVDIIDIVEAIWNKARILLKQTQISSMALRDASATKEILSEKKIISLPLIAR